MALKGTFPARFGSFQYQFYSSCTYRLFNAVSVEDSNSQPLKRGMRGLFVQDLATGKMNGWVLSAHETKPWKFTGVTINANDFNPDAAPDLKNAKDNKQWSCSKKRVVFDDIKCSRSVKWVPTIKPGASIRYWGYRSDGRTHKWEASQSQTVLEGPAKDPNAATNYCGN